MEKKVFIALNNKSKTNKSNRLWTSKMFMIMGKKSIGEEKSCEEVLMSSL